MELRQDFIFYICHLLKMSLILKIAVFWAQSSKILSSLTSKYSGPHWCTFKEHFPSFALGLIQPSLKSISMLPLSSTDTELGPCLLKLVLSFQGRKKFLFWKKLYMHHYFTVIKKKTIGSITFPMKFSR